MDEVYFCAGSLLPAHHFRLGPFLHNKLGRRPPKHDPRVPSGKTEKGKTNETT